MVPFKFTFRFAVAISIFTLLACDGNERETFESRLQTRLEHRPPKTHIGTAPVHLPVQIQTSYALADSSARLLYRNPAAPDSREWRTLQLTRFSKDSLLAGFPPPEKGTTWEYYYEVTTPTGEIICLPRSAPEKTFQILFKGAAAGWLKMTHRIVLYLMLLSLALAAFFAYPVISKSTAIDKAIAFSAAGFIFFITGTLLGIGLKIQVYGVIWQGFPFGTDMTDLFSLILLIYWTICLAGMKDWLLRRPWPDFWYSDTTFAWLTLAGSICSVIVGLLGHHL